MTEEKTKTALLFNIQRFSIHDGPGIRTTLFFKGCPLRCFWCHNPEGLLQKREIAFYPDRCIGCGDCLKECPKHAHQLHKGSHIYVREQCSTCGQCVEACFSGALEWVGSHYSLDRIMQQIMEDKAFYETSGGGVTLSGGEPVMQADFSYRLLQSCRRQGIHTALETCGHYAWKRVQPLLEVTDLIMMDLKTLDDKAHRRATGVSNRLICENARRLALTDRPVLFRIPVIPTVNDTPATVAAIRDFVDELQHLRRESFGESAAPIDLELLPFHQLATDKYASLGLLYKARNLTALSKSRLRLLNNHLSKK